VANTQGIRAGRAYVELGVGDKLSAGLKRAQMRLKAFAAGVTQMGAKIAMIGGAAMAPLLASVKHFASAGDKLDKMANRTGMTVEALSELAFAAEQSGAGIEIFEKAVAGMQRSIRDAGRGLSTKTEALKDVGLSYKALAGLSPEDQFSLVAEAISRIPDASARAAISMELFGRSGRQLLPMLLGGAKGIAALREEARQLGLTVATKDAKAAAKLTDTMNALWKTLKRAAFTIGSALAPAAQLVAEKITAVAVTAGQWLRQNKGLVISIAQIAGIVLAGGIALMGFGKILAGLSATIGLAVTAVKLFGAILGLVLSPIGMVVAAVAGLSAYLLYASGAAGKALGWLGGKFATLKDDAMGAYQGIADALAAGDIGLAAKILWLTLKIQWKRGVAALLDVWLSFKHGFLKLVHGTWYGAQAIGELIWHGMEIGWIETTSFFSQTWAKFVAFFKASWVKMKAAAEYAWTWIKSLFDDSIDMEAARDRIKSEADAALQQIDDDKTRALKERELKRQREREAEEQRHQGRLLEIGKAHEAKKDAMADERRTRMAAAEKELRDARQEWQDALKKASAKRKKREAEDAGPGRLKGAEELLGRIQDATAGLGEKLKTTVRGTFNAAAIGGFASGSAMDRTAAATEQTAKNTRKIERIIAMGGSAFA